MPPVCVLWPVSKVFWATDPSTHPCVCVMACFQGVLGHCSLKPPVCLCCGLFPRCFGPLLPQPTRVSVLWPVSKVFWATAPSTHPCVCVMACSQGVLGHCSLKPPVCLCHGLFLRCFGPLLPQTTRVSVLWPVSKVFWATAPSNHPCVCVMACFQGVLGHCTLNPPVCLCDGLFPRCFGPLLPC